MGSCYSNSQSRKALLRSKEHDYGTADIPRQEWMGTGHAFLYDAIRDLNPEQIREYVQSQPDAIEATFVIEGYEYTTLMLAVLVHVTMVRVILDLGANINRSICPRAGRGSTTALNLAVMLGDIASADLLLSRGADINGNEHGNGDFNYTPLMVAVSGDRSMVGDWVESKQDDPAAMVEFLVEVGADVVVVRNANRLLGQKIQVVYVTSGELKARIY